MIRATRFLVLALFLAGCTSSRETESTTGQGPRAFDTTTAEPGAPAPDPPASSGLAVSFDGYGPVRTGMTRADAEQALGVPLVMLGPEMEPCHYVRLESEPRVAFMMIEGRVVRVDIDQSSPVRTAEGAAIGDTEERIRSLYPGFIEVQPHKYVDGNYLIVRPGAPADSNRRIIFETDGTRVTKFRAGRMPEVRWVEGCS